jgi:Integrase core domain.
MSAVECADLFFEHWVCKFGMPLKIISDRDSRFTSSFWQELIKLLHCKVSLSSAYHPQTDGLTERFHRSVE